MEIRCRGEPSVVRSSRTVSAIIDFLDGKLRQSQARLEIGASRKGWAAAAHPSASTRKGDAASVKTHCSAKDAAKAILEWAARKGCGITNLRLNLLLYFVQAYFITLSDGREQCFPEKIEARSYGVVVPDVHSEYRGYGSLCISHVKSEGAELSKRDRQAVEEVAEHFSKMNDSELSELVLKQTPWRNAFHPYCFQDITVKSIADFFLERKEGQGE